MTSDQHILEFDKQIHTHSTPGFFFLNRDLPYPFLDLIFLNGNLHLISWLLPLSLSFLLSLFVYLLKYFIQKQCPPHRLPLCCARVVVI